MGNVIIEKITSCMNCKCFDTRRTADPFDHEFIGVCSNKEAVTTDNEVGYGDDKEDFPIPDWCPILLKQNSAFENQ